MSGPPGVGILNRGPYNGLPTVGGAPPRGIDGGLPSGTVTAGYKTDMVEPMANATATHPVFIAPMRDNNEMLENDILMVRRDDRTNSMSNYGVYGRPLRLLQSDAKFDQVFQNDDDEGEDKLSAKQKALAEADRWKCLGIVVAVGAGSDNDRQIVNVAIRGRIAAPNIFRNKVRVKDKSGVISRGDIFAVSIKVVEEGDTKARLVASTEVLRTCTDLPPEKDITYHLLGTYIRPLGHTSATLGSIQAYLENRSILDRKGSYELAIRL